MSIEQLQPANQRDVSVYLPYQGNKRNILPLAISLYQKGVLEGKRKIEASDSIPFVGMSQPYLQISPVAGCSLMAMWS